MGQCQNTFELVFRVALWSWGLKSCHRSFWWSIRPNLHLAGNLSKALKSSCDLVKILNFQIDRIQAGPNQHPPSDHPKRRLWLPRVSILLIDKMHGVSEKLAMASFWFREPKLRSKFLRLWTDHWRLFSGQECQRCSSRAVDQGCSRPQMMSLTLPLHILIASLWLRSRDRAASHSAPSQSDLKLPVMLTISQ